MTQSLQGKKIALPVADGFEQVELTEPRKALAFVKAFFDASKPVAVICHGTWTLIDAGVLRGRRLASYPSL